MLCYFGNHSAGYHIQQNLWKFLTGFILTLAIGLSIGFLSKEGGAATVSANEIERVKQIIHEGAMLRTPDGLPAVVTYVSADTTKIHYETRVTFGSASRRVPRTIEQLVRLDYEVYPQPPTLSEFAKAQKAFLDGDRLPEK